MRHFIIECGPGGAVTRADGITCHILPGSALCLAGGAYDSGMRPMDADAAHKLLDASLQNLSGMNGIFCGVYVRGGTARIFADRAGAAKIFYSAERGRLLVSDRMDAIVRAAGRAFGADMAAWADMLKYHAVLGVKTYYRGIRTVRAGEAAAVDLETGRIDAVEFDRAGETDTSPDDAETAGRKIAGILADSIRLFRENGGEEMALTLSGGLDSRLLAGIAAKLGLCGRAYCLESDLGVDEYGLAKPAADRLGLDLKYVGLPDDYYEMYLDECLDRMEYGSPYHVWFMPFARAWGPPDGAVLVNGVGGNNLFRLDDAPNGTDLRTFAGYTGSRVHEYGGLLAGDFAHEISAVFRNDLYEEAGRFFGKPGFALRHEMNARLARNINYLLSMYDGDVRFLSPFYYSGFLDYVQSLREDVLRGGQLYRELYGNVDPGLMELPSTRSLPQGFGLRIKRINAASVRKLRDTILDGSFTRMGLIDKPGAEAAFASLGETPSLPTFNKLVTIYMLARWLATARGIDSQSVRLPAARGIFGAAEKRTVPAACFGCGGKAIRLTAGKSGLKLAVEPSGEPRYVVSFGNAVTGPPVRKYRSEAKLPDFSRISVSFEMRRTDGGAPIFLYLLLFGETERVAAPQQRIPYTNGEPVTLTFERDPAARFYKLAFRFDAAEESRVEIGEPIVTFHW